MSDPTLQKAARWASSRLLLVPSTSSFTDLLVWPPKFLPSPPISLHLHHHHIGATTPSHLVQGRAFLTCPQSHPYSSIFHSVTLLLLVLHGLPLPLDQNPNSSHVSRARTCACVHAESLQSSSTPCDPMDCRPQAPLSVGLPRQEHWSGLPLKWTFPTQGPNLCLLHSRQFLYQEGHLGSAAGACVALTLHTLLPHSQLGTSRVS